MLKTISRLIRAGSTWPSKRLPENARQGLIRTLWQTRGVDFLADGMTKRPIWLAPLDIDEDRLVGQ